MFNCKVSALKLFSPLRNFLMLVMFYLHFRLDLTDVLLGYAKLSRQFSPKHTFLVNDWLHQLLPLLLCHFTALAPLPFFFDAVPFLSHYCMTPYIQTRLDIVNRLGTDVIYSEQFQKNSCHFVSILRLRRLISSFNLSHFVASVIVGCLRCTTSSN